MGGSQKKIEQNMPQNRVKMPFLIYFVTHFRKSQNSILKMHKMGAGRNKVTRVAKKSKKRN